MAFPRISVRWLSLFPCFVLATVACSGGVEETDDEGGKTVRQRAGADPQVPGPNVTLPSASGQAAGIIPGQVIVKYKSEGLQALTQCAERWLDEGKSFTSATADGSASLDVLHKKLAVRGAKALMPGRRGLSTADAKQRLSARAAFAAKAKHRLVAPNARGYADLANLYVLEIPKSMDVAEAARKLAADPHVEYAQPNYAVSASLVPNDPYFSSTGSWGQAEDDLWGIKKIAASTAWDTQQGDGAVVAVVDSGLDTAHPDIAANVWRNSDEIANNGIDDDANGFVDDVNGWNFVENSATIIDDVGHGTHVAGTIAAIGNNGLGVIGVAPRAKIQPLRGLGIQGGDTASLAQALAYAVQNGADVINNSWGCSFACPSNPIIENAVDVAHDAGVTVVFAAGNSGSDITQYSPNHRPNVIAVSASDPADARVFFSNFGFVDVAAPGGGGFTPPEVSQPFRNILSLRASGCHPSMCPPDLLVGDAYVRQAGTSMAAPHVSGVAALIVGAHPTWSPEQVRQALRRSSQDAAAVGFDTDTGYGRVNASRAVTEPTPLKALITAPLSRVSGPSVAVSGIAAGTGFQRYFLEYGLGDAPSSFTAITNSTTPRDPGSLGTWNLGTVPDGTYTLRVRALTTDGRTYEDRQRVVVDQVIITDPSFNPQILSTIKAFGNQTISIRGSAAPIGFQRYSLAVAKLDGTPVPTANITATNGGNSAVVNGVLGTWNTAGMAPDAYQIIMTVQGTGGPFTDTTQVIADPTEHVGWPVAYTPIPTWERMLAPTDHLTLADVNRDGKAELLLGYGSEVSIFEHSGTPLAGWPQTVDPLSSGDVTDKSPVVADVTGDGIPEVIGANNAGTLFVWRATGQLLAQKSLTSAPCELPLNCTPSIAVDDVDANGVNDIITTDYSGNLSVHRVQSGLVTWFTQALGGRELSAPAVGDINGDSRLEIVVSATGVASPRATDVYVFGQTGVLSGWPRRVSEDQTFPKVNHPTLGDVNRDGKLDIVVSSFTETVTAFAANGTILPGWPRTTQPATPTNSPTLGDLNGDGRMDVMAGVYSYWTGTASETALFSFRDDGSLNAGWPQIVTDLNMFHFGFGATALADIDGDGGVEAVAMSDGGVFPPGRVLRAHRADGTLVPTFPKPTVWSGVSASSTPSVADTDGDGLLELATLDLVGNIYMWDLTASASSKRPWPMFQHDAQHTGRADPLLRATIESRDNNALNNLIQPKLRVVNGGGGTVPLSQLTVRYWYTNETFPQTQVFQLYLAQMEPATQIPSSRVTSRFVRVTRPQADTYLEIGFTSTAGNLASGGAVGLEFNVHAANWANYSESNDYSYSTSTTPIDWSKVTVYRNGVLIWGKEP